MENDDLKYNGCCGSFEGLYTFLEAAKIYGVGDSCFRKQVARNKLVEGVDVKKMGTTWIITGWPKRKENLGKWISKPGWKQTTYTSL